MGNKRYQASPTDVKRPGAASQSRLAAEVNTASRPVVLEQAGRGPQGRSARRTSDMRIRRLTPWLAVLGVSLLGACTTPTYGLTVSWTFAGNGSCAGAGIDQVRVTIPGEALGQSIFDCASGQVTFSDFYEGTYTVRVDALDPTVPSPPTALWSGTATVTIRGGSAHADVQLAPQSGVNALTYLSWTLDPATGDPGQVPRCGNGQRLDKVAIYIDDTVNSLGTYDCAQGINGGIVATPYVAPGSHTVYLVAFSSQESVTAFAETAGTPITFTTGSANAQTLPLHWNVGGLQVGWGAYASITGYPNNPLTCPQTGITDVVLGFASGQTSGGSFGLGAVCAGTVILDNVAAGTWAPYIDACASGAPGLCGLQGGGPPTYQEAPDLVNPKTVTVQPGRFFAAAQAASFNVYVPIFPR